MVLSQAVDIFGVSYIIIIIMTAQVGRLSYHLMDATRNCGGETWPWAQHLTVDMWGK